MTLLTPFFFAELVVDVALLSKVVLASVAPGTVARNKASPKVDRRRVAAVGELKVGEVEVALARSMVRFQLVWIGVWACECSRPHYACKVKFTSAL